MKTYDELLDQRERVNMEDFSIKYIRKPVLEGEDEEVPDIIRDNPEVLADMVEDMESKGHSWSEVMVTYDLD